MLHSAVDSLLPTVNSAKRRRGVALTVHVGSALLGLVVAHTLSRAWQRTIPHLRA